MHATIFDPPPPRPLRPGATDVARRRDTVSISLYDNTIGVSSCGPGGADSVAIGGSSVLSDGRELVGGMPRPAEVVIGGRTDDGSSRGSTAALNGGSGSARSMLTFELLRECGADEAEGTSGDCDTWSGSPDPSSRLSPSLSLPYCFRCLPDVRRLLLAV